MIRITATAPSVALVHPSDCGIGDTLQVLQRNIALAA
jgi:hypothetical protein